MKRWFRQMDSRIEKLSVRERLLAFISGVAVLFIAWDLMFLSPQMDETEHFNVQLKALDQKLAARAQEATVLAQGVGQTVNMDNVQQLAALKAEIERLDAQMEDMSLGLVAPEDLLTVVRDVLEQSNDLIIDRIEYLPPEEVEVTAGNRRSSKSVGVYKHTVELSLEGSFFDLLTYLQGLEGLPWRIYWDGLDYEVSGYPLGDIELRVSTLSETGVSFETR